VEGRHRPERTCIGCRDTAPKPALVRVVRRPDGEVAVDWTGREPGRGAYVHPGPDCVAKAARRGGLARGLRTSLDPPTTARLVEELVSGVVRESR
jgi:predicted RNA-binding protein YlxR (DUF448 family)